MTNQSKDFDLGDGDSVLRSPENFAADLAAEAATILNIDSLLQSAAAHGLTIVTTFVYPPIPFRDCDWQAYFDCDEPNDNGSMMHGSGRTEQEAIADLLEQAWTEERI